VDPGSPAAKAGLRKGDIIRRINRQFLKDLGPDQREQALRQYPLTLEVERVGQTLEIRMTLGPLELIPATDTPQVKPQNAATRKEA
jgi:S1-C subfamily serine protease